MVPPVLEWRRGAMLRDLHMGTYAFWGTTPGNLRGLEALGAGRRSAASNLYFSIMLIVLKCVLIAPIINKNYLPSAVATQVPVPSFSGVEAVSQQTPPLRV